jgi:Ca2+-transporting ATPase
VREGAVKQVLAREIVPGDMLVFEEGDNISADCRFFEEYEMKTNNSTLTGESVPVKKTITVSTEEDQPLTEADNLAFTGTSVAAGTGRAVVFATGMKTQFGKIALLTQTVGNELSPFKRTSISLRNP